ncbi:hypothetical protein [Streptomyces reniochalinae]|uniref:hypothetical protein n=1 Tax=Streptomyces reniochalinae TaxID=2250578 RepID=UPI0015F04876|nr:hypothetical protein [Streptomyces reniochalinae]
MPVDDRLAPAYYVHAGGLDGPVESLLRGGACVFDIKTAAALVFDAPEHVGL